jgi:hypothetical protein
MGELQMESRGYEIMGIIIRAGTPWCHYMLCTFSEHEMLTHFILSTGPGGRYYCLHL